MLLPKIFDDWVRQVLKRRGYVFMRQTNPAHAYGRRLMLMRNYGITLVLDVGANSGQYSRRLRDLGYEGRIVSFEPMRGTFDDLRRRSEQDPLWQCHNFGLGEIEKSESINVSENSVSSSFLAMLPEHQRHAPASRFISNETVTIKRLDALPEWGRWRSENPCWLKIDVQGYESEVLAGASGCMDHIAAIQIELSLRPLYEQQLTIIPMMQRLSDLGFDPVAFEPGFYDKESREYLQVDGIFRSRHLSA